MKVAYFTALRELRILDEPEPVLSRAGDVLLRMDRVGVCGSDVHYYANGRIANQIVEYPATLGHESAATVMEIGAEVRRLKIGDRVAVDPALVCGTCDQCARGRVNTCRNLQFMGCPGQAPGAVAEYRVLPAENCYPIPASMSLDAACLVEPLSVGLQAVRMGQVHPDMKIAILGAGPIGLSVLLSAKAAADCTVYMTDLLERRLEMAARMGADWSGNPDRQDVEAAVAQSEPAGLDLVFECSGNPACINQGLRMLGPGGTLVIVGIPSSPAVEFDVHRMRTWELSVKNVRRQVGCIEPAIRLLSSGQIDARPLITHRFGLAEIREAFELAADYRDGVIKAVLDISAAE
jgi:L-iditol 2-dehydrogenase